MRRDGQLVRRWGRLNLVDVKSGKWMRVKRTWYSWWPNLDWSLPWTEIEVAEYNLVCIFVSFQSFHAQYSLVMFLGLGLVFRYEFTIFKAGLCITIPFVYNCSFWLHCLCSILSIYSVFASFLLYSNTTEIFDFFSTYFFPLQTQHLCCPGIDRGEWADQVCWSSLGKVKGFGMVYDALLFTEGPNTVLASWLRQASVLCCNPSVHPSMLSLQLSFIPSFTGFILHPP